MFAKLYEDPQVLVKLGRNSCGDPVVRIYAQPEGYGPCSVGFHWTDSDEGWDKAELFFRNMDEVKARQIAEQIHRVAGDSNYYDRGDSNESSKLRFDNHQIT